MRSRRSQSVRFRSHGPTPACRTQASKLYCNSIVLAKPLLCLAGASLDCSRRRLQLQALRWDRVAIKRSRTISATTQHIHMTAFFSLHIIYRRDCDSGSVSIVLVGSNGHEAATFLSISSPNADYRDIRPRCTLHPLFRIH